MAVLIATPGAIDANSYATVAEGDLYHETRLHVTEWTGATMVTKTAAIIWATRLLNDHFDWSGTITTETQALPWPRYSAYDTRGVLIEQTVVPQELKNATAELARLLIIADREAEPETAGINSMSVGSLALSFNPNDRNKVIRKDIIMMLASFSEPKNSMFKRVVR